MPSARLAVDIGGTFTDLAAFDEGSGKLLFGKALSTHDDLPRGIQNTLDGAGVLCSEASLAICCEPASVASASVQVSSCAV